MKDTPTRIVDEPDASGELRDHLAAAARVHVRGIDSARGLAGLQAAIAAEQGTGAATAASSSGKAGSGALLKLVVAGAVIGGAALAWELSHDAAEPSAIVGEEKGGPLAAGSTPRPHVPAVDDPAPPGDGEVRLPPEPEHAEAEVEAVDGGRTAPHDGEAGQARGAPARPHRGSAPKDAAGRSGQSKAPRQRAAKPGDAALREAQLVAKARKALAGDPVEALSLARQAAREFPSGRLASEREAIAIRALVKLGRSGEAQRRGDRFLRQHGSGPHAEGIRRALERAKE